MVSDTLIIILTGGGYAALLFLTAWLTEHGFIKNRLIVHPITYILSLGVFASVWAVYGSIGFAYQFGYSFLAYFVGISAAFLLAPIFLAPILRLSQAYQLRTLADLFVYRYRSQAAGAITTLCMLIGVMPLMAMQIQALSRVSQILSPGNTPLALILCSLFLSGLFTCLFGTRQITSRRKHEGMVVAIAQASLIKLIGFICLALIGSQHAFGTYQALQQWLSEQPQSLEILYGPMTHSPWRSLVLAFFTAAIAMPHMYHMIFSENLNAKALIRASWGFPAYLFLLALCIPFILWSAMKLDAPTEPEYFTLGLGQVLASPFLKISALLVLFSAATSLLIVTLLPLAIMVLNHWILPVYQPLRSDRLYARLVWIKRSLIGIFLIIAYVFYLLLQESRDLSELGLLSFVVTLQFLPGILGVIFWPKANSKGFITGLIAGFSIWLLGMCLPMFATIEGLGLAAFDLGYSPTVENWQAPAIISIVLNGFCFVVISLLYRQSPEEEAAANNCTVQNLRRPYRQALSVSTVDEFIERLSEPLGFATATREVKLALEDSHMDAQETRPYALRRLRDQIESNLSSLLGPALAQEIIDERLPYQINPNEISEDIYFIEQNLEYYQDKLTGLAGELDQLRRLHRQTLKGLPIGVASFSHEGEILSWNNAMENLTDIQGDPVLGSNINTLPPPWNHLLNQALSQPTNTNLTTEALIHGKTHWLSLHSSFIKIEERRHPFSGVVIVIEDLTEVKQLEAKLAHSERLASIGRLAAGVAHEIGNPVTGIACLAQDLKNETTPEAVQTMSSQILDQTNRITTIVQSLVNFSHSGQVHSSQFETLDLRHCIEAALRLINLSSDFKSLIFENHCKTPLWTSGDPQRLQQVFINLLDNAQDASPPHGKITIEDISTDTQIMINLCDEGDGIPEHLIHQIFDPFVTTKPVGQGTGLGLYLVYSIVQEHHGQITINSPRPDCHKGTQVIIQLPRTDPGSIHVQNSHC